MNKLARQLNYLYALERFGVRMGLEVMEKLMRSLGNPEKNFKSVHISGTNGKGSTAILTANALQAGEYKVGMYTSPHLIAFNERIRIDGQMIGDEELSELVEEVQGVVGEQKIPVTFFEFTTAIAFLYFARQKVDIAVVEVGLGGDLDATNVIHPLVAAITNIGHDHTNILGLTKQEVASHKAGIFKTGSMAITSEEDPKVLQFLESKAREKKSKFFRVQDTVQIRPISTNLEGQKFAVIGSFDARFSMPLLGNHQLANAATALTILFYLSKNGFPVEVSDIQKAFAKTQWPGRLQVISKQPLILVDGAHNEEGAQALHSYISKYGSVFYPRVLVLAMKKDKDMPTMLQKIVPIFEKVIVTEGSFEPTPAQALAAVVKKHHADVTAIPNVNKAIAEAKRGLQKDDLLLVTGSLYMIGDALVALKISLRSWFRD